MILSHRHRIAQALADHLAYGLPLRRPPGVPRRRWWRAVRQVVVWLERCTPDAKGVRQLPGLGWWWRSPPPGLPLVVGDVLLTLNLRAKRLALTREAERTRAA